MSISAFRIGHGFDVHPLVAGRRLVLGGVVVPHDKGLAGHSDADVLLHAVADAFLGAVAGGDIGQWFPDSQEQYRDADSRQLLEQIIHSPRHQAWHLVNLDCTIMAEQPRLAIHVPAIRHSIASLFAADPEQISVKATTCEKLGFVGREEGIAVSAVVLLSRTEYRGNNIRQ